MTVAAHEELDILGFWALFAARSDSPARRHLRRRGALTCSATEQIEGAT